MTHILLTSKPSRSINTETMTLGDSYLSILNNRSLICIQSFSFTSPLALLSIRRTSFSANPSSFRNDSTNGVTLVSSQITIIFGRFLESSLIKPSSRICNFRNPARSIKRCPSLNPITFFRSSRKAL